MSDLCTVELKCSSAGRACAVDDRACQSDAIARGLEITCERLDPRGYVYCPPGGEARDSRVVWILLAIACFVALVGGAVSIFVFRKKTRA